MASVDASSYASIAAALAACAAGDRLYCPNGTYTAPTGGLIITQSIEVIGETGTIIQSFNTAVNEPVIDIQVPAGTNLQRVILKNLQLKNASAAGSDFSGNYGIKCVLPASASTLLQEFLCENVTISGMGDTAFYFKGDTASNTHFIFPRFQSCRADSCRGYGWLMEDGAATSSAPVVDGRWDLCFANNCRLEGIRIDGNSGVLTACYFENCCQSSSLSATTGGHLRLRTGHYTVLGCEFEDFTSAAQVNAKRAIVLENAIGSFVAGCHFTNAAESADTSQRCIYVFGGGGSGLANHIVIGPARVNNCTRWVEVDTANTKVDIYEPFNQGGTVPTSIVPATMHLRSWT